VELRLGLYFLILVIPSFASGAVLQTVPEALVKVFSEKNNAQKKNAYLTGDQIKSINHELEYKMDEKSTLVTYYEYFEKEKLIGTAYIDTDIVRKETESLMIVISPEGQIRDIEVLSFHEPKDYIPPTVWKNQFKGKTSKELYRSKSNIVGITGATLTSKAVTKSVQKTLAIHHLLHPVK
jgi:Na+-translocating ferredoxin:NAD+ oxidoreductase RnfG subunit